LGFWLDKWLGTMPLFLIVFFFLGFAAGFMNIYRAQMGKDFSGKSLTAAAGNETKTDENKDNG